MFLAAGFNERMRATGVKAWTRHVRGGRRGGRFAPAMLMRLPCGDRAWLAIDGRFLVWGDVVVLGSHYAFKLPWVWQHSLPQCDLETRREAEVWPWAEEQRRKLEGAS